MKFGAVFGAALGALAIFVGTQACTSTTDATDTGVHCTPGNYVFCRCADRTRGTKLCKEDGASFETCSTDDSGECTGGEDLTDPQTGTPVDPPDPKPEEDGGPQPTNTALDSCPGAPTAIGSSEVVIKGDTTGAKDKSAGRTGACAVGSGGGDHIYHLQPTATGALSIKVQALAELNPTLYLRSVCDDVESQVACGETTGAGGAEQFQYNVINGHDYYLYVDAASGTAGEYALNLKLTPGSFCGDGKVDLNEACDDTNKTDGDGCSPGCNAVNGDPPSGGSCPGQAVHMWPGKAVSGTGSTTATGYANTFTKTGTSCTVSTSDLNTAKDHVYAVTAHGAGTLKVTLTPQAAFNAMLVARKTCADPTTQAADMCANLQSTGGVETMSFAVTNGQTVYVAAEGVLGATGTYTIKFEL